MTKSMVATFAIGLLVSMSAFAHDYPVPVASDSWATIVAASQQNMVVQIHQTTLADAFGSQGFFNACVAGDNLQSIVPLQVCTQQQLVYSHSGGGEGSGGGAYYECVAYADQPVVLPLQQTANTTCAEWQYSRTGGGEGNGGTDMTCVRYNTVDYTLSTSPEFSVFGYQHTAGPEGGSGYEPTKLLFTKTYQIPACN